LNQCLDVCAAKQDRNTEEEHNTFCSAGLMQIMDYKPKTLQMQISGPERTLDTSWFDLFTSSDHFSDQITFNTEISFCYLVDFHKLMLQYSLS